MHRFRRVLESCDRALTAKIFMQVGIMTRMIVRPTIEQVADAVREYQLQAVQLSLVSAGMSALPAQLSQDIAVRIGDAFRSRGILVAAISANFNSIHPDPAVREEGIRRAGLLASRCAALGTSIMTVCTGTRDPDNMWHRHPANREPSAWFDLLATTRRLLRHAEDYHLTLVFEPELANVIDSAVRAERFLNEIDSPRLRVLLDPANLISSEDLADTHAVLMDALERLGPYVALSHAKDVAAPAPGELECRRVTAGKGFLDYQWYLGQLSSLDFNGALIMHDLLESEINGCRSMLQDILARLVC